MSSVHKVIEKSAIFFRWWGAELSEFLPPRLRRYSPRDPDVVDISVSSTGETEPALESLGEGEAIELHLDSSVVLSHEIRLPAASRRTTEGMARIQMGRVFPLVMADLYTDWRGDGLIQRKGDGVPQQAISLYAAKRKVLGPVFEMIRSKKLLLGDITLNNEVGFSTLAPPDVRRYHNQRTLRRVALGALAFLTILSLPYVWVWNVRSENEVISQDLVALRTTMESVAASRSRLDEHDARVAFLAAEESNDLFPEVVALLSSESPETVLLRELVYEPGTVRVAGFASSAADWVLTLGKLAGIADVKLQRVSSGRSPKDPENFDIVIELENGAAQ